MGKLPKPKEYSHYFGPYGPKGREVRIVQPRPQSRQSGHGKVGPIRPVLNRYTALLEAAFSPSGARPVGILGLSLPKYSDLLKGQASPTKPSDSLFASSPWAGSLWPGNSTARLYLAHRSSAQRRIVSGQIRSNCQFPALFSTFVLTGQSQIVTLLDIPSVEGYKYGSAQA